MSLLVSQFHCLFGGWYSGLQAGLQGMQIITGQAKQVNLTHERFCTEVACPDLAPICNLRPSAPKQKTAPVLVLLEEDAQVQQSSTPSLPPPPAHALGALLAIMQAYGVTDPAGDFQQLDGAEKTQETPLEEDPEYIPHGDDKTVVSYMEPGQDGPQCPEGYYMWRMSLNSETNTAYAACNRCAPGCENCQGPRPDDCMACPLDKTLHIDISGRTVCLDDCPECFVMSEEGQCEFDQTSGPSCAHQAAFNPNVMPEDRGDPASCAQLDALKPSSESTAASLLSIAQEAPNAWALGQPPALWTSGWQTGKQGDRKKSARRSKSAMRRVRQKLEAAYGANTNLPGMLSLLSESHVLNASSANASAVVASGLEKASGWASQLAEGAADGAMDMLISFAVDTARGWFDGEAGRPVRPKRRPSCKLVCVRWVRRKMSHVQRLPVTHHARSNIHKNCRWRH